jgi:hypothetical protein
VRLIGRSIVSSLVVLLLLSSMALAHGESRIRDHRFTIRDGSAKARGEYVTEGKHRLLTVTAFIVEAGSGRIVEEKSRRCNSDGCRRVDVQLKARCVRTVAYYAVIQGDTRGGGHFAVWNSPTLVCE